MKKNISILFLAGILIPFIGLHASQLTLRINNFQPKSNAGIIFPGEEEITPISVNKAGEGTFNLDKKPAGYATLMYGTYYFRTIWVDPVHDLTISFDSASFKDKVSFEGANAAINNYLNNNEFGSIMINDARLPENTFITKADSIFTANLSKLDKAALPSPFAKQERARLKYVSYDAFPYFETFHIRTTQDTTFQVSDAYWKKLEELTVYSPELLQIDEYNKFIANAINLFAKKEYAQESGMSTMDKRLKYIESNVNCAPVIEYLIFQYTYGTMKRQGIKGISDNLNAAFQKYVKKPELLAQFNVLYTKLNKLSPGNLSPELFAKDINGVQKSLSDYAGKYVYIDIWATWCVPCRREIPYMEKLEEKYKDKNIYFISLSCDQNKEAWENNLKKRQARNIQLRMDDNNTFMKSYEISSIPHFILLDTKGNIINSDMSRPSDPKTTEELDKLLK